MHLQVQGIVGFFFASLHPLHPELCIFKLQSHFMNYFVVIT